METEKFAKRIYAEITKHGGDVLSTKQWLEHFERGVRRNQAKQTKQECMDAMKKVPVSIKSNPMLVRYYLSRAIREV